MIIFRAPIIVIIHAIDKNNDHYIMTAKLNDLKGEEEKKVEYIHLLILLKCLQNI
jgi:hypothetical protein